MGLAGGACASWDPQSRGVSWRWWLLAWEKVAGDQPKALDPGRLASAPAPVWVTATPQQCVHLSPSPACVSPQVLERWERRLGG